MYKTFKISFSLKSSIICLERGNVMYLFIEYPKCSTCKRAKKFLDDNNISYQDRNIVTDNPSKEELRNWVLKSGLDINKFFSTSSVKYRELGLKDKIKSMSFDEKLDLLSSDGKLIKRPLIVGNLIILGFKDYERMI